MQVIIVYYYYIIPVLQARSRPSALQGAAPTELDDLALNQATSRASVESGRDHQKINNDGLPWTLLARGYRSTPVTSHVSKQASI